MSQLRTIMNPGVIAALWLSLPVSIATATIVASIDIDGALRITSDANDTIRISCSGDTLKVSGAAVGDPPVMCQDVFHLHINAGAGDDRILLDRWGGDAGIFPNLYSPVTISDDGGIDLIDCSEAPTGLVLSMDQEGMEQEPFANGSIVIFTGQFENVLGTAFDDELSLKLIPVERTVDGGAHENGDLRPRTDQLYRVRVAPVYLPAGR